MGPENDGGGPLELLFSEEGNAEQQIQRSDGTMAVVGVVPYRYHPAHGHYHIAGLTRLQLFRVDNGHGLTAVGQGKKIGFCLHDFGLSDWESFHASTTRVESSRCSADHGFMQLSAGWYEIYDRRTVGNYVDVPEGFDGDYVLRATVDADSLLTESNEEDNSSYVYFSVHGDRVQTIERGYGTSPWAPERQRVDDWPAGPG